MTEMVHDYGSLAGALAKAQSAFPPIVRDKEVAVRSYSYKYAPLDAILAAVREPLAVNGLAIAQLLEGADLVTLLLHESGSTLTARTPLPPWEGVQQYGSMVTYIRRYALTAMLGIATEDDDDGEAAAKPGKRVTKAAPRPETPDHGGMVGYASAGKGDADMNLRTTPTGHALAFRLTENLGGTKGFKVLAFDSLAEKLADAAAFIEGQRVTAWGSFSEETFEKDGRTIPYRVLTLERIETPAGLFVAAKEDSLEEHVTRRVTAVTPDRDEDDEITQAYGARRLKEPVALPEDCGEVDPGPMALGICIQPKGHKFMHRSAKGTWPVLRGDER
jgi:ERF superfamily